MLCAHPVIRLTPITSGLAERNPKVLLGGSHQPTLLRYLDGWPKRWNGSRAFLINFACEQDSLRRFATNQFDMAVIQAPSAERRDETIKQLLRVAKQGLITLR